MISTMSPVALLAEGVDRNMEDLFPNGCTVGVALLAEGVDRNYQLRLPWQRHPVALLAEGVDRNRTTTPQSVKLAEVALLAEGVDRNSTIFARSESDAGRPPRGGRG